MIPLEEFLIRAKKETYASGRKPIINNKTGKKRFEYSEAELKYLDEYVEGGSYFMGEEKIRAEEKLKWQMFYFGIMFYKYWKQPDFIKETFAFLREALQEIPLATPVRGPPVFSKEGFEYINQFNGRINDFHGFEHIKFKGKKVYNLVYYGGIP